MKCKMCSFRVSGWVDLYGGGSVWRSGEQECAYPRIPRAPFSGRAPQSEHSLFLSTIRSRKIIVLFFIYFILSFSNSTKWCPSKTSGISMWPSPSPTSRNTTSPTRDIIWDIWSATKDRGVYYQSWSLKVRQRARLFDYDKPTTVHKCKG